MLQTTQLRAAKKFGPGYFINEQLELRDWTQEDLAEILGVTTKHINRIIKDKQTLTLDIARKLGEVFNTSAQYWINIDTTYRLWLQQERTEEEQVADMKAQIFERMPVSDMVKKGWLPDYSNVDELKHNVQNFWGWKKLDFTVLDSELLPCLTRKSTAFNQFNASYAITWYQMARNIAAKQKVETFSKANLEKLYNTISEYSYKQNGINDFIAELNRVGVIFFVLPHLQKTYLDGAAFYYNSNPVIVYTGRYKRIDNFWFTVAHEIAHILKHLNRDLPFILDNLRDGERNQFEDEADMLAAEKLRHPEIIQSLEPYLGYLTTNRLEECAETYHVHPAIIIGKLAHDKKISYSNQTLYNENVLELINSEFKAFCK